MIEVINQQFLLAVALEFKIADIIEEDRQALCQAAATFSDNAKTAQANVVRTMAASHNSDFLFRFAYRRYGTPHVRRAGSAADVRWKMYRRGCLSVRLL